MVSDNTLCDVSAEEVLILVVMEDGLRQHLNETDNGRLSLNPCCNGRWSPTNGIQDLLEEFGEVLILVVMEDGLRLQAVTIPSKHAVLILVVMEDGLRPFISTSKTTPKAS